MAGKTYPKYFYNRLSIVGTFLAVTTAVVLMLSLGAQHFIGETNPYVGIIVYMVLPPFIIVGLIMVPVGMLRRWRHFKKTGEVEVPAWPYLDLNKKPHRNVFLMFAVGGLLFVTLTIYGGYHAFHYTESVAFCGTTCHTVMKPEHVAYQNSPHARVSCTACHVGSGASWYAKSKLSGAYQVYAVMADIFPRPIPTPIRNLRPAQETCEQCHWPEKFYGGQQKQFNHFMYDEENSAWPINLLIKTGGGDPKTGQTAGIHWHMNIGVDIRYIARDERRQDIPWIQVTDSDTGRQITYQDENNPLTEEEINSAVKRKMDCMDCHNRPSHIYRSPDLTIDNAILTGEIDGTLPSIKRLAVEAMDREFETEEEALREIANFIENAYRVDYPEVFTSKREAIEQAIISTQKQFSGSIFPEMKVRWDRYPDNIGHFIYPGCMRCHDGSKVTEEGLAITTECTACHIIFRQGSGEYEQVALSPEGLKFIHPDDPDDDDFDEIACYDCHTGVQP
jgi:hypothetical protein